MTKVSRETRRTHIGTLMLCCGLLPLNAQGPETARQQMERLIDGSAYLSVHPTPSGWIIPTDGPGKGAYDIYVAVSGDVAVIGAVVAQKQQMQPMPALYQALLRCNHDFDYVKIGLDADGDAFVRMDIAIRRLDAEGLKNAIGRIRASTDSVFLRIKPYLR